MQTPSDLRYTQNHEWVRVEDDKVFFGITDYAQYNLGDIVFVEIPEIDAEVTMEESIAVIESVKAVSEVFSPVSGTILEANEDLEDSPELINEAPYENWIGVISLDNGEELEDLLSADEYIAFCADLDE
ncbi:MAG TPA: glycine cleavage system protein GcvH [Syntrophomonadaceae bacterium]|nr:glycine cleavage system protein GcvH [Syntrophomonadaceae bacterium]